MRPYNLRGEGGFLLPLPPPSSLGLHPIYLSAFLPACLLVVAWLQFAVAACNGGWSCVKPARRSKEGTQAVLEGDGGGGGGGGGAAAARRQPVTSSLSSSQIGAEFVQLLDQQAAEVHGGGGGRTDGRTGGQTPRGWFLPSLHFTRLGRGEERRRRRGEPPPSPLLPLSSSASILSLLLLEEAGGCTGVWES